MLILGGKAHRTASCCKDSDRNHISGSCLRPFLWFCRLSESDALEESKRLQLAAGSGNVKMRALAGSQEEAASLPSRGREILESLARHSVLVVSGSTGESDLQLFWQILLAALPGDDSLPHDLNQGLKSLKSSAGDCSQVAANPRRSPNISWRKPSQMGRGVGATSSAHSRGGISAVGLAHRVSQVSKICKRRCAQQSGPDIGYTNLFQALCQGATQGLLQG